MTSKLFKLQCSYFHLKKHLFNTHLLEPRSSSSAKIKVKYEGHILKKKKAISWTLIFHKKLIFLNHNDYYYFHFLSLFLSVFLIRLLSEQMTRNCHRRGIVCFTLQKLKHFEIYLLFLKIFASNLNKLSTFFQTRKFQTCLN